MKIVYFVHNLNDPGVEKRVRMFLLGGCDRLVLLGFRRSQEPVQDVAGIRPHDLGQTRDGDFGQRILAIANARRRISDLDDLLAGADAIVARNLECLYLAFAAERRLKRRVPVTYESIDIHDLLLEPWRGWPLRRLERALLRKTHRLMTSSPAFMDNYFNQFGDDLPPQMLVENKLLPGEHDPSVARTPPRAPWRIGWFGSLRCRKSLDVLSALADDLSETVEIVIAGRPSAREMPDFDDIIARHPNMTFLGPYDRHRDLPRLYASVHFAWCINYYEAGGNGDWLLANRLYEGGAQGAVCIADASTQMGRWLNEHGIGLCLTEPVHKPLTAFFEGLTEGDYTSMAQRVHDTDESVFVLSAQDCRDITASLCGNAPALAAPDTSATPASDVAAVHMNEI